MQAKQEEQNQRMEAKLQNVTTELYETRTELADMKRITSYKCKPMDGFNCSPALLVLSHEMTAVELLHFFLSGHTRKAG
jgi:hypothetical protein